MTKRQVRTYTETERLGLMFLALEHGESWVEREKGVARSTLSTWFSDAGGLAQARMWLEEQTQTDYLRVVRGFYEEALRRMADLTNAQILAVIHRLIEARDGKPVSPVSISMSQQQGQAQGGNNGAGSAAERAYIDALRGQPSLEGGQDDAVPALPLPGDAPSGSESPTDSR